MTGLRQQERTLSTNPIINDLETGEEEDGLMADGGRSVGGDLRQRLDLKIKAVESLSEPTRKYLHVSKHGKPIPTWMKWDEQPKHNKWNYYMSQLYTLMTDGTSSRSAWFISRFMITTIIISVVSFCLETVPSFQKDRNAAANTAFTWVEAVTIQIFAAEYLLRLGSSPDKFKFVREPFNIIDLIAIVPWYIITWIGTTFTGTTVFRVIRLFRALRVFRLGGRYPKLPVVLTALRKSLDMLALMCFLLSLSIVFFATLMFYAERGKWDERLGYYVRPMEVVHDYEGEPQPSPFESIVSGFWWAIVTLMTVGYGDAYPVTAGGKVIVCVAVICGVLSLALPISVIGTTFSNEWAAHEAAERLREAAGVKRKHVAVTSPALLRLHRLLSGHLANTATLLDINRNSELALDEASGQLHATLKTTKKQLHTEAKADLRLRKVTKRLKPEDDTSFDEHYGYLSLQHVKERFREQLGPMAAAAQSLGARARHVNRMGVVNELLLDPGMAALVARLAKKHADLAFLLAKHEEKPTPLSLLEAETSALQGYVEEISEEEAKRAHGGGGGGGVHRKDTQLADGELPSLPSMCESTGGRPT
ncbi:hypothetical protein Agub_g14783 [Astrephomene gubernaculifera]|uniref:Ion transport domain-containing protein n=1 Tax=Astrephomene gubernaculifera TaxID=47775 RepID=A0AAD3HSJ2_9CHLO|nr:hypothetical protein Agub_g14783 [Astrephomene gubernaculifera]